MNYYVLGNWKCNGSATMAASFAESYDAARLSIPDRVHTGLALPFHLLPNAPFRNMPIGGQDVSPYGEGAYTGEISAGMLASVNCQFCLVGHSERRAYFDDRVPRTAEKLNRLLDAGILPVLCIGETLEQRRAGQLEAILTEQLAPVHDLDRSAKLVIAYEPVWAIGTGVAASPEDVASAHDLVKHLLPSGAETPVLYGGSVKPANAETLAAIDGVDGFLIGGASLKPEDYTAIIRAFNTGKNL